MRGKAALRRLLTEPRRIPFVRERADAHWFVVGTVCVGAFMGQLDASIVTQAFPTLQHDFHASLGDVQWVGLAYLLTLVSLVTAVGRLADMVGRKLLYIYGFGVFVLGSALCGLAPNLLVLDAFRVLQAIGAAMLQANSVAIIVISMPRERLGQGIGVQGAAQALGLSLGPTVGGFLIALGGWPLIFFVNVPVGIVGIALGLLFIPRSQHLAERRRFDWSGLGLFVAAVSSLLVAVSYGNQFGWGSPFILGTSATAVLFGVAFVFQERRVAAPMLDLTLFRRAPFSLGIVSGLLSYLVLFGLLFVIPYFLERSLGEDVARAGLELTAMPLAIAVTAPFAGRFADRLGARVPTAVGMLLTALGCVAFALFHPGALAVVGELLVVGVGLGFFTPPNNAAIMGSAPRNQSGAASGVLNMTRGTGTALGLALTGLVFGLVAGSSTAPAVVGRAAAVAVGFLALVAFVAMGLASLRGGTPLASDPVLTAE